MKCFNFVAKIQYFSLLLLLLVSSPTEHLLSVEEVEVAKIMKIKKDVVNYLKEKERC